VGGGKGGHITLIDAKPPHPTPMRRPQAAR
jgi:hypothetical protein